MLSKSKILIDKHLVLVSEGMIPNRFGVPEDIMLELYNKKQVYKEIFEEKIILDITRVYLMLRCNK